MLPPKRERVNIHRMTNSIFSSTKVVFSPSMTIIRQEVSPIWRPTSKAQRGSPPLVLKKGTFLKVISPLKSIFLKNNSPSFNLKKVKNPECSSSHIARISFKLNISSISVYTYLYSARFLATLRWQVNNKFKFVPVGGIEPPYNHYRLPILFQGSDLSISMSACHLFDITNIRLYFYIAIKIQIFFTLKWLFFLFENQAVRN